MALQAHEALNSTQKYRKFIRQSFSLLTRVRKLYRISYCRKLKKIMPYSLEQRVFIVLEYHRLDRSPIMTRRSFQQKFKVKKGPDQKTIRNLFNKFERTGSVADDLTGNVGCSVSAMTPQNVQAVEEIVKRNPQKSIRRAAAEARLSNSTTYRIMRKGLKLFPYKIQCHQAITNTALRQREDFAHEILKMIDDSTIDVGCLWFTDEAHFHLEGFVNKQNWRIWGTENPSVCLAKPLHSEKVTVWAGMSSKGIIGPFFTRETITSFRYIEILQQFVATFQSLEDTPENSWFMQDGARPHRTTAVFEFLEEYFSERVIALHYSRVTGIGMDWPPYSPDLNPCDFFLWGYLKDTVYSRNPQTLEQLQQFICEACASISVETLQRVTSNFILRLRHVIAVKGGHIETIVM